jgi:hypothetical protein
MFLVPQIYYFLLLIFVNFVFVFSSCEYTIFCVWSLYYFDLVLAKLFILELDIAICRIFDFNFSNKD